MISLLIILDLILRTWTQKRCDQLLNVGDESLDEEALLKEDEEAARREKEEKKRKKKGRKTDPTMAGLPEVSEENKGIRRPIHVHYIHFNMKLSIFTHICY
jgi:hypothetical protein